MQNPLTRQLEGFQDTPPLWENKLFSGLRQFKPPKVTVKDDHSIIAQIPSVTTNFVLGKRMESFLELQVKNSASYLLIAKNIQIHRNRITVGELDFLLKDLLREQVIHLEMVYKFYVYDPSFEKETERWIGPNRKDSLLKKIDKIITRQFPLLHEPETAAFLDKFGIEPGTVEQQVCFKANLFLPMAHPQQRLGIFNSACIAGYWLHLWEFTSGKYSSYSFYTPKKQEWPVHPKYNTKWLAFSEIMKQIEEHFHRNRSPLIWMKKNDLNFERFFIVWW